MVDRDHIEEVADEVEEDWDSDEGVRRALLQSVAVVVGFCVLAKRVKRFMVVVVVWSDLTVGDGRCSQTGRR